MKIWNSHGSEHSANLRIVGTFKNANDAQEAEKLLNEAMEIAQNHPGSPTKFSPQMLDFLTKNSIGLSHEDVDQLNLCFNMNRSGAKFVVDTDELDVQAILKVFISRGAKVEMYSRHDYP